MNEYNIIIYMFVTDLLEYFTCNSKDESFVIIQSNDIPYSQCASVCHNKEGISFPYSGNIKEESVIISKVLVGGWYCCQVINYRGVKINLNSEYA